MFCCDIIGGAGLMLLRYCGWSKCLVVRVQGSIRFRLQRQLVLLLLLLILLSGGMKFVTDDDGSATETENKNPTNRIRSSWNTPSSLFFDMRRRN